MGTAMHESVRLLRRVNASGRAKVMWVDEEDAHALRSLRSVRLRTKSDEYWYRPAELLAMEGPRFARLRRELRHVQRQHAVSARPYRMSCAPAPIDIARYVTNAWLGKRLERVTKSRARAPEKNHTGPET